MSTTREIAEAIAARADALGARAVDEMYADPFWTARFGERGRRFAQEDGRHHVSYLVEALHAGTPASLTQYARWLRTVLVTRGMCSLHLGENFDRLARLLRSEGLDDESTAMAFLSAARDALIYPGGAARALQLAAPALRDATVAEVHRQRPGWADRWEGNERLSRDAAVLISYLADAVALERPELFSAHARWAREHQPSEIPAEYLRVVLAALDAALAPLGPEIQGVARAVLAAARVEQAARQEDGGP